jgi:protein-L-isoaspartate(D-aspartate) O-methyltransferase
MPSRIDPRMQDLLAEIREDLAGLRPLTGARVSKRVLDAVSRVPRHVFVPAALEPRAYVNAALPIGRGQTISQPSLVALMTELLHPQPDHVVLEIGTGSGYQAAILAQLVGRVYSLERIGELAESARDRLARLACENVEIRYTDGCNGWPEHGPYDGIIVTAAAANMPLALVDQLKPGGIMVVPVGSGILAQQLVLLKKDKAGRVRQRSVLPVAFVPLVGS